MLSVIVEAVGRRHRLIGLVVLVVAILSTINVGLVAYFEPFHKGETAWASGMGESCGDPVGAPPLLGLWGRCFAEVVRGPLPPDVVDGRWSEPLEDFYQSNGSHESVSGPYYGAGRGVYTHARPVVSTPIGVVEPPRGWHRSVGFLAPWVLLGGLALLVWPRPSAGRSERRRDDGSASRSGLAPPTPNKPSRYPDAFPSP